jgi:dihydroorotase/N-acyl-D-amino-acid deacylase
VDGTGNPWFYGDVLVCGDRIVDVILTGVINHEGVREIIPAQGMVVCPGFIDIQSHSIMSLMQDGRCLSKITQGVTTEVMGEAWTPAPFGGRVKHPLPPGYLATNPLPEWEERAPGWTRFGDWLEAVESAGVSPNVGSFLGGGRLREYAMGMDVGTPNHEQTDVMLRVATDAMEDGAFGVSYALIYAPDSFAGINEVVSVCSATRDLGGVYITHIRSEAEGLIEGVAEAIEIGRRAEVPVEIYHLKALGARHWDKMPRVVELIDRARCDGVDVTADMYPYVASGTGLSSVLPPWVYAEGKSLADMSDARVRARVRNEVLDPSGDWEPMGSETGADGIMPIGFKKPENRWLNGMRLSDIAEMRGQDWIDAAIDLLIEEDQRIDTIYFAMSEENVRSQLKLPWMKISTDAAGMDPDWAEPRGAPSHPRGYGTYPRVLGKYVRDERVLTLEEAVRKMSSAVADRLGMRGRGLLRKGCLADIVIFDPETVADQATFERPHQLSKGVREVWVNGVPVLSNGNHTGARPGRFVRGAGASH